MSLPLPTSYPMLDQRVADYINHLHQEGESISKGGWLLSGLRRFYPRVRKELCLAHQWYTNWARVLHTPKRAKPMPWKVLQALVGLCWHEHWYHLRLCLLLGFSFFLARSRSVLVLHVSDTEVSPAEDIPLSSGCVGPRHPSNISKFSPWSIQKWQLLQPPLSPIFLISGCGQGLQPFFVTVSPPSAQFLLPHPSRICPLLLAQGRGNTFLCGPEVS